FEGGDVFGVKGLNYSLDRNTPTLRFCKCEPVTCATGFAESLFFVGSGAKLSAIRKSFRVA
ncbi:hypothetical protein, partial [Pseudomonas amygdali]